MSDETVDIQVEGFNINKIINVLKTAILNGLEGFNDSRKFTGNTRIMSLYFMPRHEGGCFTFTYKGFGRKLNITIEDPRRGKKLIKIFEKEI